MVEPTIQTGESKAVERQVIAYYSSLCWPTKDSGEEDHATVSIQWDDWTWEEIFRMKIDEDYNQEEVFYQMAEAILTHYLKEKPTAEQVRKLVHMPGQSIMRVTPIELLPFK